MVFKRGICLILCCFLLLVSLRFPCSADESQDITVSSGCHSIDAALAVMGQDRIIKNAKSVLVYETTSNTLMHTWNADEPMHPASLTKLMTALLTLEKANMEDIVTVSEQAPKTISKGAISIKLQAGEQISVKDLFYALIVYSANDAAAVLAEHIGGTQQAFVQMMNDRATELGCTGTTFKNPHGLHHNEQLMSARDTCRILLEVLKYPVFRDAFGTIHYSIAATNMRDERYLSSNNYLMNTEDVGIHFDNRVTGGRSGITEDGFRCLASVSKSGNMELICIVMGSESAVAEDGVKIKSYGGFPETIELMNRVYSQYSAKQIIYQDQVLFQQAVLNGDSDVFIGSHSSFSTVLPANVTNDDLSFRYVMANDALQAPINQNQPMGKLQIWYQSVCVAQTDVYAMNKVPMAFQKQLTIDTSRQGLPWWAIVLIVLIALIATFIVVIVSMRYSAQKRYRAYKKRR